MFNFEDIRSNCFQLSDSTIVNLTHYVSMHELTSII